MPRVLGATVLRATARPLQRSPPQHPPSTPTPPPHVGMFWLRWWFVPDIVRLNRSLLRIENKIDKEVQQETGLASRSDFASPRPSCLFVDLVSPHLASPRLARLAFDPASPRLTLSPPPRCKTGWTSRTKRTKYS